MTRHRSEEERRSQILDAARRAFIKRGYFSTSVEDIADVARLSKGGIYFRFKAKSEILKSIVDDEYERSMAFASGIIDSADSAAKKLEALTTFYLQAFTADKDAPRFSLVRTECALRDDRLRRSLLKMHKEYLELLSGILAAGVRAGEFRKVDADLVAPVLKSIMDGLECALALGYDVDASKTAMAGIDLIMNGLLAKSKK